LPSCRQVGCSEVTDHIKPNPLGEPGTGEQLHAVAFLWLMAYRLAVDCHSAGGGCLLSSLCEDLQYNGRHFVGVSERSPVGQVHLAN
jgi:hypothetical protein